MTLAVGSQKARGGWPRMTKYAILLVLAALAGGGWWFYHRLGQAWLGLRRPEPTPFSELHFLHRPPDHPSKVRGVPRREHLSPGPGKISPIARHERGEGGGADPRFKPSPPSLCV